MQGWGSPCTTNPAPPSAALPKPRWDLIQHLALLLAPGFPCAALFSSVGQAHNQPIRDGDKTQLQSQRSRATNQPWGVFLAVLIIGNLSNHLCSLGCSAHIIAAAQTHWQYSFLNKKFTVAEFHKRAGLLFRVILTAINTVCCAGLAARQSSVLECQHQHGYSWQAQAASGDPWSSPKFCEQCPFTTSRKESVSLTSHLGEMG